jgi:hypothetical protein
MVSSLIMKLVLLKEEEIKVEKNYQNNSPLKSGFLIMEELK